MPPSSKNYYSYLFCYGSNNLDQLRERLAGSRGTPLVAMAAVAPGYKRVFRGYSQNWGGGTASLVKSESRPAHGFVVQITQDQFAILDKYEGVGRAGGYKRMEVMLETYGKEGQRLGPTLATAYVHTSTDFSKPSRKYLEAVAKTIGTCWEIDGVGDIKVE